MTTRRLLLAATCMWGINGACSDSGAPQIPTAIAIAPVDTFIPQRGTFIPRVTVVDSAGHQLSLVPTLTSRSPAIVAITPQGGVRSVGPIGEAVIVATLDSLIDSMTVRVLDSMIVARRLLPGYPLAVAVWGDVAYVSRVLAARVQVLSLTSLAFVDTIATSSQPCGVARNSTGTKVYVANQGSNNIGIIDVATGLQSSFIPVNGNPLPVAISPSDSVLFVTTTVDRLYKVKLGTNTVVDSLSLPATSHYLLAHPNDTLLYVATRDGGSVLEVNWRTMTVARTFAVGGRPQGMVLAPDRSELYVVNESSGGQLHIVTLSSGSVTSIALETIAHSVGLSADGTKLYVGLLFAGKVNVFNRVARTLAYSVVTGGTVRWMDTDVARGRLIVANEDGWVDILR